MPSICNRMSEEIREMPLHVWANFIEIGPSAVATGRSQWALMELAQPRQSMNTKTCKKELPTFMIGDTPNARTNGFNSPKKQAPKFHLHHVDTMEVVFKHGKELFSESIATADGLDKSLKQQGQSGCPLLWDQQQVLSVSKSQLSQAILVVPTDN